MMDDFRASLNKCGCGGIKCNCCRPVDSDGKKDDTWTRHARRSLKQKVDHEIKGELEMTPKIQLCKKCMDSARTMEPEQWKMCDGCEKNIVEAAGALDHSETKRIDYAIEEVDSHGPN